MAIALFGFQVQAGQYATPESQGVSSEAILSWIEACEKKLDCVHGFVIRRNGKIIAEGCWKPFNTLTDTHILYSHSKSFTSTAIGFLADEGKLDLDERIVSIFPDDLPEKKSERLMSLRIRDLLTMNQGTKAHRLRGGGDWVKSTLAGEFISDPGRAFRYDSDATYLLAAIVEKKSGMKLMDYLDGKLFKPLGFGPVRTTCSPQAIACGGWGMHMSTRDISKFGQLYLNEGMWNGKRIISRDWVRLATTKQTSSGSGEPLPDELDWYQGYGFQFWMCRHNAYRADGAGGQFTIVMPDQNAVVSINSSLDEMATEINLVWDYLLKAMKDSSLPENPAAAAKLSAKCASLELKTPGATADGVERFVGEYKFKDNNRGIKKLKISKENGAITGEIETRSGVWKFPIGVGEWKAGKVKFDPETYDSLWTITGEQQIYSAVAVMPNGAMKLRVHSITSTQKLDLTSNEKDGKIVLSGRVNGFGRVKLEAERL